MKIGFIGAGKVGTTFGKYLVNKNFELIGYYSRSLLSAQKSAKWTNSKSFENIYELVSKVNLLFITTSDDYIKKVCDYLVLQKWLKKEQIIIHMSGALSSKILESAEKIGCSVYSLHPLQSFANQEKALKELNKTIFSLEGSKANKNTMISLLNKMGNKYFTINSKNKILYHASACVFSNYLVTLLDYGLKLLKECGIEKEIGLQAMKPLIEGTIKNTLSMDTKNALTGPIARGDIHTLKNHLDTIEENCPEYLNFYKTLAIETFYLAQKEKLKETQKAQALLELLGGNNNEKNNY